MTKSIIAILIFSSLFSRSYAKSPKKKAPVVFIHGWLGWGEGEMLGLRAWGGPFLSIRHLFEKKSYKTIELSVGPLSSSWDKAAEAYYQLKGGCTDYGLAHSREHGHDRFGRCYKAKLPNWGNNGSQIHLIGHSLGAVTSRLLIDLLHDGNEAELLADYKGHKEISALYTGGKSDWVKSLNSVASPHNGTPLTNHIYNIFPKIILRFAQAVNALSYFEPLTSRVYDFQVEHWQLLQKKGESYNDFLSRFMSHRINKGRDVSLFDLKPEGAFNLNRIAEAKENVFYVSWPIYTTVFDKENLRSVGTIWTSPLLNYISRIIGTENEDWRVHYNSDLTWLKNDGLVPTEGQKCPIIDSNDICLDYNGSLSPGVWNVMPEFASDHLEIIGLTDPFRARTRVKGFWLNLRDTLIRIDEQSE